MRRFDLTLSKPGAAPAAAAPAEAGAALAMRWALLMDGDGYGIPTHESDQDGNVIVPPLVIMEQNNYTRGAVLILAGAAEDAPVEWLDDTAAIMTDFDSVLISTFGPIWQMTSQGYGNDEAIVTVTATLDGEIYTAQLNLGSQF